MKIKTYIYYSGEGHQAELIDTLDSLFDAIKLLESEKIDFFQIVEDEKFIELTLNNSNEIIINGYEL